MTFGWHRNRIILTMFLIGLVFSYSVNSFAQTPSEAINSGTQWLLSSRYGIVHWGLSANVDPLQEEFTPDDFAPTYLRDSIEAIIALQAVNVTLADYEDSVKWLSGFTRLPTGQLAQKVGAMSRANRDFSADLLRLLSYKNTDGGFGGRRGYPSDVLDTALALQGLVSAHSSDTLAIYNAVNYLLSAQNADGGWGFASGRVSHTYYTALVMRALATLPQSASIATAINNATAYLLTKQNPDGGFGSGSSTVYETALTFEALIASGAVGADKAAAMQNAVNYLTTTQSLNGSWNDDPYSTALAIRALANEKPNLFITAGDIYFSNYAPIAGETITITANIKNTGPLQADNVVVQFYDGDPGAGGVLIGSATIPSISAYGSSQAGILWTVITASARSIFVKVDSLNSIDELSEADNAAYKNLTSATLPDLTVASADITISPPAPEPNTMVSITVNVRNHGEADAPNVLVEVYDGDPSFGGALLTGSGIISNIPGGGVGIITASIAPQNVIAGKKEVYVLVDPQNSIPESNDANNAAVKTFYIGPSIDLTVLATDISFNPLSPKSGEPVTISAVIGNNGTGTAKDVAVRFYLGNPKSGGIPIGSEIIIPAISARGNAAVSTVWNTAGNVGNKDIYIFADPDEMIGEENEYNNIAFKTIRIGVNQGPDLALTSSDITFLPDAPKAGEPVTITADIRNIGNMDANNVYIEFSLGDPNVGGTLIIGSQTIPFIPQAGIAQAQITWNPIGYSGAYELYVNADPFNELPEMNEANNTAHLPLPIASTAPDGHDLAIRSIEAANLIIDTQSLAASGSIKIMIENKGNQSTTSAFDITVFEDRDKSKGFTGADNIIGKAVYTSNLTAGAADTIDIPISGSMLFRDNLVYVMADSGSAVSELDETNNIKNTGQQCEYRPPVGSFNPVEKWRWTESSILSSYRQVMHQPAVARIIDTNNDGVIDNKDIPAIIFNTFAGWSYLNDGVLRAVRGDNGQEIFTVTNPAHRVMPIGDLAVGDIDNDGLVEIIAPKNGGGVIAFEHDGTFKWLSPYPANLAYGGAAIADIDNDGKAEIVIGATVLNNDGTLRWQGEPRPWTHDTAITVVADINLDGVPEIIVGNTAYKNDGSILWKNTSVSEGFNAIANFDGDPFPEIVLVGSGKVYLLEHTGDIKWGPVSIPGGGSGGAPTIADFDGDGRLEIGVAGAGRYVVYKDNGAILWQSVTSDYSSTSTGSSVFDFEGDGQAEAIYNDEYFFRIYRGKDGVVLFQTPNSSGTVFEYPLIVDVDNDNNAEIVVIANNYAWGAQNGIRVFEDANDNWVNTRKIWNQHTYHITNINDDGTIPKNEQNNWEIYNNYRCNSLLSGAFATSDITASYITADQTNYPASVAISVRIGNGGAVNHPAGVDISFYNGDPNQGGALIGAVKTTKALEAGDYEDVSVIWNNPTSGSHTIYVVADKDNKFNECREYNNIASALLNIGVVQPPIQMPDLSITSSDVVIIPPNIIEGQSAVITAIIRNIGTLGASDVSVSFYDGDPKAGGMLIGSVTKPYIEAGATALAEATWNTFGQSGKNYIHVIIDPQNLIAELNENNNSTLVPVDVALPSKPDLAITASDITFSSLSQTEGAPLAINAVIHNLGTDVGNSEVYLYDGNPASGGLLLSQKSIPQIIPFGGKSTISFNINTIGLAGSRDFYVTADPNNQIDEAIETNNTGWNSLSIGSSGLSLGVSTDKTVYTANEDVSINVNIGNLISSDRTGALEVKILDMNNNVASSVSSQALTFSPNENKTLNYIWNTGQTLAGNYKVYSHYIENSNVIARAETPITISPAKNISSKITTDKISYSANQTVAITSSIKSLSVNYIFQNLNAKISVINSHGQTIFTDEKQLPSLTQGQIKELKSYWNTTVNPKGQYTAKLEVFEGAALLSASTAAFEIIGSSNTGAGLSGTISAQPNPVYQGMDEIIAYTVTNNGNEDILNLNIKALIVDPETKEIKAEFSSQQSISKGSAITMARTISTINLMPKMYLAILQAGTAQMALPITLASTNFTVMPSLKITKEIKANARVLIWLCKENNDHYESHRTENECKGDADPLEPIIKEALKQLGIYYYLIVYDKKDFETHLRSNEFNTYMVFNNHEPIEDHIDEELTEHINAGKGIIAFFFKKEEEHNMGNSDEKSLPIFGVRFKGYLPDKQRTLYLADTEVTDADTITTSGKVEKTELLPNTSAQIMAYFNDGTPAIITNTYGQGKAVLYTFDLRKTTETAAAEQLTKLIKKAIKYTAPAKEPIISGGIIPITIKIQNLGSAAALKIEEQLPANAVIITQDGQRIGDSLYWQINLNANETKEITYHLTAPDTTNITLHTNIYYLKNNSDYELYDTIELKIDIKSSIAQITTPAIEKLNSLTLTDKKAEEDKTEIINILTELQNLTIPADKKDANKIWEEAIKKTLKAIDELMEIKVLLQNTNFLDTNTEKTITETRLLLDELLMFAEIKWYGSR